METRNLILDSYERNERERQIFLTKKKTSEVWNSIDSFKSIPCDEYTFRALVLNAANLDGNGEFDNPLGNGVCVYNNKFEDYFKLTDSAAARNTLDYLITSKRPFRDLTTTIKLYSDKENNADIITCTLKDFFNDFQAGNFLMPHAAPRCNFNQNKIFVTQSCCISKVPLLVKKGRREELLPWHYSAGPEMYISQYSPGSAFLHNNLIQVGPCLTCPHYDNNHFGGVNTLFPFIPGVMKLWVFGCTLNLNDNIELQRLEMNFDKTYVNDAVGSVAETENQRMLTEMLMLVRTKKAFLVLQRPGQVLINPAGMIHGVATVYNLENPRNVSMLLNMTVANVNNLEFSLRRSRYVSATEMQQSVTKLADSYCTNKNKPEFKRVLTNIIAGLNAKDKLRIKTRTNNRKRKRPLPPIKQKKEIKKPLHC